MSEVYTCPKGEHQWTTIEKRDEIGELRKVTVCKNCTARP